LDESLWEELEEVLILADVGVSTTASLVKKIRSQAKDKHLSEPSEVLDVMRDEIVEILQSASSKREIYHSDASNPNVILLVGVNGVGKTTSIAKLAHHFKQRDHKVLLAASDTFRAAAIDQLSGWGQKLGIDVISHGAGGDPAAIAFDALEAAQARSADVLIVDTAGRLHTNSNLMEEMKKISRVLSRIDPEAPHEVLLVLDATTGQNGLIQARAFNEAAGCTGVFIAKLDGTAKGGIVVPIVLELGLPILFIGTGEGVEDIAPFHPREFVDELFSINSD
jgi:fused signal recognition particle receptor